MQHKQCALRRIALFWFVGLSFQVSLVTVHTSLYPFILASRLVRLLLYYCIRMYVKYIYIYIFFYSNNVLPF